VTQLELRGSSRVKINAAVLREVNKGYSIEELELEPPRVGEALVKYAYTGFCHSDLSDVKGRIQMKLPMVAGHECAGVVQAVGPGVTRVKVGGVNWSDAGSANGTEQFGATEYVSDSWPSRGRGRRRRRREQRRSFE
jgi:threonine dehydrogenase-like Zn-dependent dehydrogenase